MPFETDNGFIWPPGGVAPVIYPDGWIGGDHGEQSQELLDAAAGALERLRARSGESADKWAERLAPTFFADLDRLTLEDLARRAT